MRKIDFVNRVAIQFVAFYMMAVVVDYLYGDVEEFVHCCGVLAVLQLINEGFKVIKKLIGNYKIVKTD